MQLGMPAGGSMQRTGQHLQADTGMLLLRQALMHVLNVLNVLA